MLEKDRLINLDLSRLAALLEACIVLPDYSQEFVGIFNADFLEALSRAHVIRVNCREIWQRSWQDLFSLGPQDYIEAEVLLKERLTSNRKS